MPAPKAQTQLRSFIGMAQYYARFMPNLATELAPLHWLLKKNVPWQWTETEQNVFENVKSLLLKDNVLVHWLWLTTGTGQRQFLIRSRNSVVLYHAWWVRETDRICTSLFVRAGKEVCTDRERSTVPSLGSQVVSNLPRRNRFQLYHTPQASEIYHGSRKGSSCHRRSKLQRWCLFLGAFSYTIQYRNTKKHANCDSLFQLPLAVTPPGKPDETEVHQLLVLETLPVKDKELKVHTINFFMG